ncbi:type III secretion protein HrpB2 [Burkholderia vietnamiensis]|uniref:type III secretion protein HrpB2 n=1 Tax=Burkholderia vietnamiensis TaxID=60552 RepID=UPI001B91C283|nr:type III secretion protein HrpB2 [Burkholderia vietnamiensis]MBR8218594.1 type III secretion protein HrpB2 [Burkholderia vietnamiensis]MCA8181182.1 type III secretion protein HrpB2 [Burkholderia vietnamiensis]
MSIDPVSQLAPAALDAMAATPAAASPATTELGDKFRTLMARAPMAPPEHAGSHLSSSVSKAIEAQDVQFRRTIEDVARLTGDLPGMSMTEMTQRTIQMMYEMTSMQMNMQVKMSLAESSKSSVQTLMKNQ